MVMIRPVRCSVKLADADPHEAGADGDARRRSADVDPLRIACCRIDPDDRPLVARRPDGTGAHGDREGATVDLVRVLQEVALGVDLPDLVSLVVGQSHAAVADRNVVRPERERDRRLPSQGGRVEPNELAERGDSPERAKSVGERTPDRALT